MASSSSEPSISIIIPTKDNEKDLIDCLGSILELEYNLNNIEILIWDNNSEPECKEKVKFFLNINKDVIRNRLLEYNSNHGVYTSRDNLLKNIGPKTEFILSIDDDVILPENLLISILPLMKDKSIGIAGPRTVYDDDPTVTAHGAGFINWWLGRYSTKDVQSAIECDYIIGCCMLIRKEVIDVIGGFDRDYYTSHGEVDFCLRAKKKGFKVLYSPRTVVRHRVDQGGTRTLERMYYVYRNKLLVIKKNWPIPQKWIAVFLYSILWFPKAIIDSLFTNKNINYPEIKTIVRAMFDGWMNRYGKRM